MRLLNVLAERGIISINCLLGEGGFGAVYRGKKVFKVGKRDIPQDVAIKIVDVLKIAAGRSGKEREEVLQKAHKYAQTEIEAALKINSPYMAQLFDCFYLDGRYVLIMEYVDGRTLEDILEERGAFRWGEIKQWVLQLCEAVRAVHEANLVHRDIKPSNIIITRGAVKLLDFGIATRLEERDVKTTASVGTPAYSSPEQSFNRVSRKSDVWSIGATLAELLMGMETFESFSNSLQMHKFGMFPKPNIKDFVPDLEDSVAELISACLEKDVEKRISLDELIERIKNSDEAAVSLAPTLLDPSLESSPTPKPQPLSSKPLRFKLVSSLASLLIAAGAGVSYYFFNKRTREAPSVKTSLVEVASSQKSVGEGKAAQQTKESAEVEQNAQKRVEEEVVFVVEPKGAEIFSPEGALLCVAFEGRCVLKNPPNEVYVRKAGYVEQKVGVDGNIVEVSLLRRQRTSPRPTTRRLKRARLKRVEERAVVRRARQEEKVSRSPPPADESRRRPVPPSHDEEAFFLGTGE